VLAGDDRKAELFAWFGVLRFLYHRKAELFAWFGVLRFLYHRVMFEYNL
jgi:hypothetical protein